MIQGGRQERRKEGRLAVLCSPLFPSRAAKFSQVMLPPPPFLQSHQCKKYAPLFPSSPFLSPPPSSPSSSSFLASRTIGTLWKEEGEEARGEKILFRAVSQIIFCTKKKFLHRRRLHLFCSICSCFANIGKKGRGGGEGGKSFCGCNASQPGQAASQDDNNHIENWKKGAERKRFALLPLLHEGAVTARFFGQARREEMS